jgi:hypothetical protein
LDKTVELQPESTATVPPMTVQQPSVPSTIYRSPNGYWEKGAEGWGEHSLAHPEIVLHFVELQRNADYIYLVDHSRVKDDNPDNPLLVRIPVKGGTVQWSWSNPVIWIDLTIVAPNNDAKG